MSNAKPERTEGPYKFDKSFLEITKEGDLFWIAKVDASNRPENECRELGIDLVNKLNSHDALVADKERLEKALEAIACEQSHEVETGLGLDAVLLPEHSQEEMFEIAHKALCTVEGGE